MGSLSADEKFFVSAVFRDAPRAVDVQELQRALLERGVILRATAETARPG